MIRKIVEIRNTTSVGPVDRCIYCGSRDALTDEHVIPFGLGGNLVLTSASCKECNKITSSFEQRVLRGFMRAARTAGAFPTRRPRERPKTLPLDFEKDGIRSSAELTPEQHPGFMVLPVLANAGNSPEGITVIGYETLFFGEEPKLVATSMDVKTIGVTQRWQLTSFARMVAKIAYSYCVATSGFLPLEDVLVLPFILGEKDDGGKWLGSASFTLECESVEPNFAIGSFWRRSPFKTNHDLLVANVKLFASAGTTGYEVAVCERALKELTQQ